MAKDMERYSEAYVLPFCQTLAERCRGPLEEMMEYHTG